MADLSSLPRFAAWQHVQARRGFELAYFTHRSDGLLVEGQSTAVEDGEAFAVCYTIELDAAWRTRSARVSGRSTRGASSVTLEGDGHGRWSLDGSAARELDGCIDVDLECSALTNAFPIARLELRTGEQAEAPAAYVRALDLTVERLEQRYRRRDGAVGSRYEYFAPAFDFRSELLYDEAGLLLEYPGIAARVVL